jgi:hypothetical protein
MREARGGDGDAIRSRLAYPLQLKIILSSSSGRAAMASVDSTEVVSEKITFSERNHEHEIL